MSTLWTPLRSWSASRLSRLTAVHTVAAAVPSVVAILALTMTVQASPSIEVLDGSEATIPGTFASGTYSAVSVSGTSADGTRATLMVDAPIMLDGWDWYLPVMSVSEGGRLVANADISASSSIALATINSGGSLHLDSGRLTVSHLSLYGSDAFQRATGTFAVDWLSVADGASVRLTANDALGLPGSFEESSVALSGGGQLELATDLIVDVLDISGAGSSLSRVTGTEVLDVPEVSVSDGATLVLAAGDMISALSVGSRFSVHADPSTVIPVVGTSVFTMQHLALHHGGSVVGLDSIPYEVDSLAISGQRVTYRSGTITDAISQAVFLADSGTLALQQDLTLSGAAASLIISGSGSTLERNGHAVSTPQIFLSNGATLTIDDGITVSRSIVLERSVADVPTTLTLTDNLVLAESDGLPPTISISGSGAGITRAPGITMTAIGATISVYDDGGLFDIRAGDDVTGASISVISGGRASNAGSQSLTSMSVDGVDFVTGARATYTAHAPLVLDDSLQVAWGGLFEARANVTLDTAMVHSDGGLAILSGTFAASDLTFAGTGGLTVDRMNGASYEIGTLRLYQSATAGFDAASDAVDRLELGSGGVFATAGMGGGLALEHLSIEQDFGFPQSRLELGSFGGAGGPGAWGLRTPDYLLADLETWISDGSIMAISGVPLTVTAEGGFAYVAAVPEPASLTLLASGLATVAYLARRRTRRAAGLRLPAAAGGARP